MLNNPFSASMVLVTALILSGCASSELRYIHIDRLPPQQLAALKTPSYPGLTLEEVAALAKAGAPPETIIRQLQETGTILHLNTQQITNLKNQGIDQTIVDYLIAEQERVRQTTLITELADRDARQARQMEQERLLRRGPEDRYGSWYWSFGYWGTRAGIGRVPRHYYKPAFGIRRRR